MAGLAAETRQDILKKAWLQGRAGHLSGQSEAKLWAVREVWRAEKKSNHGLQTFAAGLVTKVGSSVCSCMVEFRNEARRPLWLAVIGDGESRVCAQWPWSRWAAFAQNGWANRSLRSVGRGEGGFYSSGLSGMAGDELDLGDSVDPADVISIDISQPRSPGEASPAAAHVNRDAYHA